MPPDLTASDSANGQAANGQAADGDGEAAVSAPSASASVLSSALRRVTGIDHFPQPALVRLRRPVVLMHGFGVGPMLRRKGHLHAAAMHLRTCGVTAYAPNVPPYETVRVRARIWADRLGRIFDETGADEVVCIAHSMGGLDARYLIRELGWHDRIPALVTVSTPHQGSGIASFVLSQPEALRSLLAEVTDWVGTHILEGSSADSVQAVRELTPEHVQAVFNPAVPDHPAVRYWSYAGRAGKGTDVLVDPMMRFLNAQLYRTEGENDGFVSVQSARWGTFCGVVDAGHGQQVGLNASLNPRFDANAFYRSIAEDLAAEGF